MYTVTISGCVGSLQLPEWVGRPPLTICMSGSGHGGTPTIGPAVSYEWDFGDGSSGTGKELSHIYTIIGEYEVRLTCRYSDGYTNSAGAIVSVADEPVARFIATESRPFSWGLWGSIFGGGDSADGEEESIEMKFDASQSYPEWATGSWDSNHQPAFLEWRFGDGQTETVAVTEDESDSQPFFLFFPPSPMTIRHEYATPGFYEVTLTLTDNLAYSDTVTQTITVGTPGDDEEDLVEDFELGAIFWELDDEEEDDCIYIDGTVQNDGTVAAGVELTATAYNAIGASVGTFTYWPAGSTNIGIGVDYAFSFFLCDLSVSGEQVVNV